MPLNYQNSVVYKICCKDPEIKDIYVGSTASFKRRMSSHKTNCKNEKSKEYNLPVYRFIRNHGGFDNWSVVKIRDVCCKDKYDLVAEERKEFELLGATLNGCYPQRSKKEYYEVNKKEIAMKDKKYYEVNKKEILEKNKKYREKNKEQIKEQRKTHYEENKKEILEQKKEYHKKNKERRKEYDNKKYEKNKEKISEKGKETVECPCGFVVRKDGLTRHKKTKKHQNWEKNLQDN
jgi:hypothetical protein